MDNTAPPTQRCTTHKNIIWMEIRIIRFGRMVVPFGLRRISTQLHIFVRSFNFSSSSSSSPWLGFVWFWFVSTSFFSSKFIPLKMNYIQPLRFVSLYLIPFFANSQDKYCRYAYQKISPSRRNVVMKVGGRAGERTNEWTYVVHTLHKISTFWDNSLILVFPTNSQMNTQNTQNTHSHINKTE